LFITLGDRQSNANRDIAQQKDNLLGKIVRINTDGTITEDNPFVGREFVPNLVSGTAMCSPPLPSRDGELWKWSMGPCGMNQHRTQGPHTAAGCRYGIEYAAAPSGMV
jgi:hypothetical protein